MHTLLLLSAIVGCDSTIRSSPNPDPPPPAPPSKPAVRAEMGAHFEGATTARAAIVRGDLEAARAGFTALADTPVPAELPAGSAPMFTAMIGAARQGAGAPDAAKQAVALGATLRACGGCHAAVHARPTWEVPDAPPRDPGIRLHMARHAWGLDRMAEGLVGPSDAAWAQASAIFKDQPVREAELSRGQTLSPEAAAAGKRLHELGREGFVAETAEARAAAFSEALTTCATCHAEVGMGQTQAPTEAPAAPE